MDLPVKRVEQLNCGACGSKIDPKSAPPLSTATCPDCGAEVTVPAAFDKYLLLKVIGSGGTGIVLRALDDTLYRQVAIKVLKGKGDQDETMLSITREARALAAINNPGIVSIHELGEWRGRQYIVMELLDGGTARKFIDPDKRLSEAAVLELGVGVGKGLAAAFEAGMMHMDVKPSNILLSRNNVAKLIDFGASQYARKRKGGSVVGTPHYIAPEILRGKTPTFKSDMYSFGGTLFHLLTGVTAYESDSVHQTIMHRLSNPARAVREANPMISEHTERVISQMMAHDPDERYGDYEEMIDELLDALDAAQRSDDFSGPMTP